MTMCDSTAFSATEVAATGPMAQWRRVARYQVWWRDPFPSKCRTLCAEWLTFADAAALAERLNDDYFQREPHQAHRMGRAIAEIELHSPSLRAVGDCASGLLIVGRETWGAPDRRGVQVGSAWMEFALLPYGGEGCPKWVVSAEEVDVESALLAFSGRRFISAAEIQSALVPFMHLGAPTYYSPVLATDRESCTKETV